MILSRSTALWLRYTFDLTARDLLMIQGLRLFVASDNSADVYLNGKLVSDEAMMNVDHEFQYWNVVSASFFFCGSFDCVQKKNTTRLSFNRLEHESIRRCLLWERI